MYVILMSEDTVSNSENRTGCMAKSIESYSIASFCNKEFCNFRIFNTSNDQVLNHILVIYFGLNIANLIIVPSQYFLC